MKLGKGESSVLSAGSGKGKGEGRREASTATGRWGEQLLGYEGEGREGSGRGEGNKSVGVAFLCDGKT